MGYTIQDMMIAYEASYKLTFIAGKKAWSNSISWVFMTEDKKILNSFTGKELAVTTGIGFGSTKKLLSLAKRLVELNASGLVINTGEYIKEIPPELIKYCDDNDLPLIDVPWEMKMSEMIKDVCMRIIFQDLADEQVDIAMMEAIRHPDNQENYRKELLPYYDIDGKFQVVLLSTEGLDAMDTVERKKLSFRLQIYLENISHNGKFFYYDSDFVLVLNDVPRADQIEIVDGLIRRAKSRMSEVRLFVGVGSEVKDISNLYISYKRARSALAMAVEKELDKVEFDEMGVSRLLYSISDQMLLEEMGVGVIKPLIEYDEKHNSNYVETLECYLKSDGSIQAVAEQTFTHRNTVMYRINNIKKILGAKLESAQEKTIYLLAIEIYKMHY